MSVETLTYAKPDEVDEEVRTARGLALALLASLLFWVSVITYFVS